MKNSNSNSKRGSKGKSKRPNSRTTKQMISKDNVDNSKVSATDIRVHNNPEWYFTDPTMKQGLTRMPTMEFLGTDIDLKSTITFDQATVSEWMKFDDHKLCSPTLAVYDMCPSPGISKGVTSAINQASRKLYAKLSSSNAKTDKYAPQDLTMLILELGEIISIINHCTRAYGIGTFYDRFNRSVPTVILEGLNYFGDPGDWYQAMPAYRNRLNKLITIANSISFPKNIAYFDKCAYLYQNVFRDTENPMSPLHMMVPRFTWKLNETDYEEGTYLQTVHIPSYNPMEMLNLLEELLNDVLTSLTFNYIYSDIINLASRNVLGSDLLSFDTIPIDYAITPIYSDQFCWQIMNATIGDIFYSSSTHEPPEGHTKDNDVYPDVNKNCIVYNPFSNATATNITSVGTWIEPIIRVPSIDVSEDDLIELLVYTAAADTRMFVDAESGDPMVEASWNLTDLPDHFVCNATIYYGEADDSKWELVDSNVVYLSGGAGNTALMSLASEFDHFPLLYGITSGAEGYKLKQIIGGLGNYTIGMTSAIKNIRYASYLSLFDVR